MIKQIKLKLSNAYLVQEQSTILIDTGAPGDENDIVAALAAAGVALHDLRLILHTHVHSDHVGSTVALRQQASIPLAYHAADEPLMQRGNNGRLHGTSWRGTIMTRFFDNTAFPVFAPDVYIEDGQRLDEFGIAGRILHTPGHTVGSVSLLLDSGEAIIGDVLMGGYLGGSLLPRKPNYHYFAENLTHVHSSLNAILSAAPHTLYVGHGGPLSTDDVRARWPLSAQEARKEFV